MVKKNYKWTIADIKKQHPGHCGDRYPSEAGPRHGYRSNPFGNQKLTPIKEVGWGKEIGIRKTVVRFPQTQIWWKGVVPSLTVFQQQMYGDMGRATFVCFPLNKFVNKSQLSNTNAMMKRSYPFCISQQKGYGQRGSYHFPHVSNQKRYGHVGVVQLLCASHEKG